MVCLPWGRTYCTQVRAEKLTSAPKFRGRRRASKRCAWTRDRKDAEVQRQELLSLVQELESVGVLVVYQNAKDSSDFATCWKDKEPEVSRYSDGTVRPASSGISKRAFGAKVKGTLQGLRDRVRGWM